MDGYDWPHMGLRHPIDEGVREYLRQEKVNQADFAQRIGRNQPWLNKYMHGGGKATIDDVIRIVAALIGSESQPLTKTERELLKSFRSLEEEDRIDLLAYSQMRARRVRRGGSKGSSAQTPRMPQEKVRTAHGKQKAVEG